MANINVKLPEGVESINIKIEVYDEQYEIPACYVRQLAANKKKRYRITHKTLMSAFRQFRLRHQGLRMESGYIDGQFIGHASPAYCFAGCRISNGDVHNDTFYGEAKIQFNACDAEKSNPFVVAMNRAQDKAVLDFLGLETQSFYEDGSPALYDEIADTAVDDASIEHPLVPREDPKDAPQALTKEEAVEFDISSKQTLKIRKGGNDVLIPISQASEKILQLYAESTDPALQASSNVVKRYIELRAKKAAYDQWAIETGKQSPLPPEGGIAHEDTIQQ